MCLGRIVKNLASLTDAKCWHLTKSWGMHWSVLLACLRYIQVQFGRSSTVTQKRQCAEMFVHSTLDSILLSTSQNGHPVRFWCSLARTKDLIVFAYLWSIVLCVGCTLLMVPVSIKPVVFVARVMLSLVIHSVGRIACCGLILWFTFIWWTNPFKAWDVLSFIGEMISKRCFVWIDFMW